MSQGSDDQRPGARLPETKGPDAQHHARAETAVARVRALTPAAPTRAEAGLQRLLDDPRGRDFAIGLVDEVLRPDDLPVAGRALERLSREVPPTLPWYLRFAVTLGGGFAPLLPWLIVPVVRFVLRRMLGHLALDGRPAALGRSLARLRTEGIRPLVSLLTPGALAEGAVGEEEADRSLAATFELLERDDVEDVLIELPVLVAGLDLWDFEHTVERAVARLTPLLVAAAPRRLVFALEHPGELDLTVAVFTGLLEQVQLAQVQAGLTLPTTIPETTPVLRRLTRWVQARRNAGGAGIVMRLSDGGKSTAQASAALRQQLDWVLRPEHADLFATVIIATADPYDLAWAQELARDRGAALETELDLGGPGLLRATAPQHPLVNAPIAVTTAPESLARHLVRRIGRLAEDQPGFPDGFLASFDEPAPPQPAPDEGDADPSQAEHRRWGRRMRQRAEGSTLGLGTLEAARQQHPQLPDDRWRHSTVAQRVQVLQDAAEVLGVFRGRFVEVQLAEKAPSLGAADAEAGDTALIAVECALATGTLEQVEEARLDPWRLTLVHGGNCSLTAQASAVLAALAAGSPVLLEGRRVSAVLAEALWEAGVPRGALVLAAEGMIPDLPERARVLRPPASRTVVVVSPGADIDEAIAAITAGDCEVVLIGAASRHRRLRERLADARPGGPVPHEAGDLEAAIVIARGATEAALHSADPVQIEAWLERVDTPRVAVGSAVFARPAHRRSAVIEAGGWLPVDAAPSEHIQLTGVGERAASVIKKAQGGMDFAEFDRVRRAARSDEESWRQVFSRTHALGSGAALRYRPVHVTLRLAEGQPMEHLVRLLSAAALAGSPVAISSALPLPTRLIESLSDGLPPVAVTALAIEPDAAWEARVRAGVRGRIRLIGADERTPAGEDIRTGPVTAAGRVELLTFLREQTVVLGRYQSVR